MYSLFHKFLCASPSNRFNIQEDGRAFMSGWLVPHGVNMNEERVFVSVSSGWFLTKDQYLDPLVLDGVDEKPVFGTVSSGRFYRNTSI